MTLAPANRDELAAALEATARDRARVDRVDLGRLNRICRYAPEDLTITVEAGLPFGRLQEELRRHGQWLPVDPPGADHLAIADLLDADLSGPRRYGHGTLREHLLGLRVALANGRIIRTGGEVVKNVAGYDLMKLFVGARRSLGIIVEAAFKLLPLPASEAFVATTCPSWDDAARAIDRVMECAITPIVFDAHNVSTQPGAAATLVLGFAGTEEEVEWQRAEARRIGVNEPASLEYATVFAAGPAEPHHLSVLPSRLVDALRTLGTAPFVARAGNGVILHRGPAPASGVPPNPELARRLKEAFDPARIFPDPAAV